MSTDDLHAATFERHPDPMWIYDLETLRFLAVNDAAVRKYGYTREEFLERTIADIRPPEDVEALLANVKAVSSGPDRAGLWRHVLKDGQVIHVDINSHTLEYQGRRAELVCVRDMSRLIELERENEQLLDSERRARGEAEAAAHHFQQLFEAVPGKFIVLTPGTYEILAVSDEYLEVTMTRRDEIKGRNLFEVFPETPANANPDDGDGLRKSLDRVVDYGISDIMGIHPYPIRRPTSQGGGLEDRYWSVVNTPVRGPDGAITFIIHRVEDVTDVLQSKAASESDALHRLEERDAQLEFDVLLRFRELQAANAALREQEANLRTAQKLLGLGLWKLDPDTGMLDWPDKTFAIYGVDPREFTPSFEAYVELVHPEDREQMVANYEAFASSGGPILEFEHRIVTPSGGIHHLRGIGEETSGSDGKKYLTGIVQDVTDQHEFEERLRQSQKLEALGQLTGGIAHDFNNLLTIILGNAELLAGKLADQPAARELAEMVAAAAESGAGLTNRLLAFARRQALQPRPIDVNRLIGGMDNLLRRTLGEDIKIEVVRGGGLWTAEIDPGQLENALLNLAINARDAMPGGGHLTIETANAALDDAYALAHEEVSAGQYVMISISDTGTGMPAEVAARAFDPFFTTKEHRNGTGLGLSMVYGFVKQSGGHAKIYTEIGDGTTIRLYFPRVLGAAHEATVTAESPDVPTGSEHILVVEDDALVRQNLVSQLKSLGYRVTAAGDGPSALEHLQHHPDIGLLFTDVVMPGGMNGRQLANAAIERDPALKVLFTSGYSENAIVHGGRLDHGVHLLSKPYRLRELAAKVRKVLDGS